MQFLNEKIKEKDSLSKKHKRFIFGMKGGLIILQKCKYCKYKQRLISRLAAVLFFYRVNHGKNSLNLFIRE